MSETSSHKRAKSKAAGMSGKTETPISRGRRIDATTNKRATEIERSGSAYGLEKAARRLKLSGTKRRSVPKPR